MKTKSNILRDRTWPVLQMTLALFVFGTLISLYGPALAADQDVQANINMVADEMERWSKQCGAKPLTPEAQTKLSELLLETSRLLKQITANTDTQMQMTYKRKMEKMKAEWDPFYSVYGN